MKPKTSKKQVVKLATPGSVPLVPDEVTSMVKKAVGTGRWLVLAIRVEGDKMHVDRIANNNFPVAELPLACRLVNDNINLMKTGE